MHLGICTLIFPTCKHVPQETNFTHEPRTRLLCCRLDAKFHKRPIALKILMKV